MHSEISVAVPTRHRPHIIDRFVSTFYSSELRADIPHLTIFYDAPKKTSIVNNPGAATEIHLSEKSSLTELWNLSIILAPTDWVLVCNDDIEFKSGWLGYLEETIKTGAYDLIHLFHYGAFCIHKSLILKVGWFDERFRGGSYEDNDYQLRIMEAGLKDRVDRSHDFIRKEGKREVGHFIDHTKYVHMGEGWQGCNNSQWIASKWGNMNWSRPSYRQTPEVDWHPTMTRKYSEKFGEPATFMETAEASMRGRKKVFH